MNPRHGLLLLAGGCVISMARADPLSARSADEKEESYPIASSAVVAARRQLPQTDTFSPTLHHDRHDPGIPWDLQPIIISHPDHDDSDLVISERTQQDLFVASFLLVLIELLLEILRAGFNIHEDMSNLPFALVKKVFKGPAGLAAVKKLRENQMVLENGFSQHAMYDSINSQLLSLTDEVSSMAAENNELQADSVRYLMQQVEMLQAQLGQLPSDAFAGSQVVHTELLDRANALLTQLISIGTTAGASEQAEQLSSLAAEVRLLETELQALIAPSAPDTVSANSVVAGVAAKSKKKVWDWKMMSPIKWLKSAWGMTTGVGALGEEEEERAVEPHTVLGSEPYQIEATHTGRRLLGQDR